MDKFNILVESIKVNLDLLAGTYNKTAQYALALQQEVSNLRNEIAELKKPVNDTDKQLVHQAKSSSAEPAIAS